MRSICSYVHTIRVPSYARARSDPALPCPSVCYRPCCWRRRSTRTSPAACTPKPRPPPHTTPKRRSSTPRSSCPSSKPTASQSGPAFLRTHRCVVTDRLLPSFACGVQVPRVHQNPGDARVHHRVQVPRAARHPHTRHLPLLRPPGHGRPPGRLSLHRPVLQWSVFRVFPYLIFATSPD